MLHHNGHYIIIRHLGVEPRVVWAHAARHLARLIQEQRAGAEPAPNRSEE